MYLEVRNVFSEAFPPCDFQADDPNLIESFRARHPERAPQVLGDMGYIFTWGIYVKGPVRDAAYRNAALALEYYRNYNASVHQPVRFFHGLSELEMEDFLLCSDSTTWGADFTNTAIWANYVKWTGDLEGVTATPEGYVARCPDGRFWLSPACRNNPSQCIPVLSAWNTLNPFLQWATVHNLPLAFGRPPNITRFQELVRQYDVLHYWWEPDEGEFTDLDESRLVLPEHNALEHAEGNYRTASAGITLNKYGSALLARHAPRARVLVDKLKIDKGQVAQLSSAITFPPEMGELAFFNNQDDARTQICEWAKSNRPVWEPWLPVDTNCIVGFGFVNAEDELVGSREEAVGCRLCPAGRSSQFLADEIGQTHQCVMCPPGQHQSQIGKERCLLCDPGTFAANEGQALCSPCGRGSYAPFAGMSSCLRCGNDTDFRTTTTLADDGNEKKWIEVQGAISESYCRCAPGRFLQNGTCLPCGTGSSCPGSNALEVLPGFHSKPNEPAVLFQCFGNPARCPGGVPGTCASGWDSHSPGCSECLTGLQPSGAECLPCSAGDYFRLLFFGLLVIFATGVMHILISVGGHGSNRLQSRLVTAALCLSHLVTFAQLLAVMRQIQAVKWMEPFLSILEFFNIFSMESLLSSLWSINCFASLTPAANFLTRALLLPLFFALGPACAHISFIHANHKPTWQISILIGTLGSLCLLFFILICFVCLEPFRCNEHPNGLATMQTAHSVFCNFTDQHLSLCIMALVMLIAPVGFLAVSSWILAKELPRRVAQGDTNFIRMTSFLTMRFKPGYEAFTVIFLLRNMFIPFTPMFSTAFSLFVLGLLLMASVILVTYYKPWRSILATQVDIAGQAVLLVLLLLSGLSVQDEDLTAVMILCTIVASLLVFVIVLAAGYSFGQYVRSKIHKPYRFFLCHHKAATAALARWLKMELEGCGARFKTFIDLDSLTDLTQLFSYVSTQVETLAILGSPQLVMRKWCVGEIVTARLFNVQAVLVSLPDFSLPDEDFINDYGANVPEIIDLTTYGYGLSEVKASLRWLWTMKTIRVKKVSARSVAEIVGELTEIGHKSGVNDGLHVPSIGGCIVVDHDNTEALAAAHVLARFLAPMTMDRGVPIMVIPPEEPEQQLQQIQPSVLILMCSKNCFVSSYVTKCVLKARFLESCSVLPVIADDDFVIPEKSGGPIADEEDAEAIHRVLTAVFLEVALPFVLRSSSEDDLAIRASHIARRSSPGVVKTLRNKLWMTNTRVSDGSDGGSSAGHEDVMATIKEEMTSHAF
ncbi:unnamed protein product [Durusdinium trenchii]|uniref:Tyrosine-protein kinase ephrin type A/B receptor-like domain-containing protein n=1 Tax=Durusdinium trenchii TaxID=1381693 RepID=A0ABP0HQ97_9DINO